MRIRRRTPISARPATRRTMAQILGRRLLARPNTRQAREVQSSSQMRLPAEVQLPLRAPQPRLSLRAHLAPPPDRANLEPLSFHAHRRRQPHPPHRQHPQHQHHRQSYPRPQDRRHRRPHQPHRPDQPHQPRHPHQLTHVRRLRPPQKQPPRHRMHSRKRQRPRRMPVPPLRHEPREMRSPRAPRRPIRRSSCSRGSQGPRPCSQTPRDQTPRDQPRRLRRLRPRPVRLPRAQRLRVRVRLPQQSRQPWRTRARRGLPRQADLQITHDRTRPRAMPPKA